MYHQANTIEYLKSRLLSNAKLFDKNGKVNPNLKKMLTSEEITAINQLVPRSSLAESVYCLINDMVDLPLCAQCATNQVGFFYNAKKGYSKFCSLQCSRQHDECKQKRIQTNLEKYGYPNPKQNPDVIEKTKSNNLQKYGVTNPNFLIEVQQKISNTLTKTYSERKDQILKLKEQTFLDRYGDHPNRTEQIKKKKIQRTKEKYGVEHTAQLESTKALIRQSNLERYGVDHYSKTEKFRQEQKEINDQKSKIIKEKFFDTIKDIDTSQYSRQELAKLLNLSFSSAAGKVLKYNLPIKRASQYSSSQIETQVIDYLRQLGINNIEQGNRTVLAGRELDIFLADHKLAIEIDGVYWHSEQHGKDARYHLNKTNQCLAQDIRLLHIFDLEWIDEIKQEIWKGMIRSRLGLNQKIPARNCTLKELSVSEAKEFCEIHHLQGYVNGSIRLGLFDEQDELAQIVVLGKPRYSKMADLELLRSATRSGVTVVGGLSRLLSRISGTVISYADRRYSDGKAYEKLGFEQKSITKPNYFYLVRGQLESRIKYQKHKLSQSLKIFDPNLTEVENMHLNNFYRVWDCGNYVYQKAAQ